MRESGWSRRGFLAAMAAGTGCALAPPLLFAGPASGAQVPGWLLRDVPLVDGSGAPAKGTDVLVRGDRTALLRHVTDDAAPGLHVVDGRRPVLGPRVSRTHTPDDPPPTRRAGG